MRVRGFAHPASACGDHGRAGGGARPWLALLLVIPLLAARHRLLAR